MKKAFILAAALSAIFSQGLVEACYPGAYQAPAFSQGYSYSQQPSYYQGQNYSQGQSYYQVPAQQQTYYTTEQTTEPNKQDQSYYYYRNDQRPNFQQQSQPQSYPAPTERLSSWKQRQNVVPSTQGSTGYFANDQYRTDTTTQTFRAGQPYSQSFRSDTTTPATTTQMGTQQDITR